MKIKTTLLNKNNSNNVKYLFVRKFDLLLKSLIVIRYLLKNK